MFNTTLQQLKIFYTCEICSCNTFLNSNKTWKHFFQNARIAFSATPIPILVTHERLKKNPSWFLTRITLVDCLSSLPHYQLYRSIANSFKHRFLVNCTAIHRGLTPTSAMRIKPERKLKWQLIGLTCVDDKSHEGFSLSGVLITRNCNIKPVCGKPLKLNLSIFI